MADTQTTTAAPDSTTPAPVATPAPGIYRNVPAAEYRAWDAINVSSLKPLIEKTAEHYYYELTHPKPTTAAMVFGTTVHTRILESEDDDEDTMALRSLSADGLEAYNKTVINVTVGGPINPTTGKCYGPDSQKFKAWCDAQGPGKIFLTTEQDAQLRGMHSRLMRDENIAGFIGKPGDENNELSLLWIDDETGLLCKARLDMWRPQGEAIGDLKTCRDASPAGFAGSIGKFRYHGQSAFYLDGARKLGMPAKHFIFIPVEKTAPYVPAMYRIQDGDVEIGRQQNRKALATIADCRASGFWPGYDTGFADVGMKSYAAREMLKELSTDFT